MKQWDLFTAGVFGFGLVHGLGLATRFQALGVPDDGLAWKLVAFNVGVELGQLTAIIGMLGAGAAASMLLGGRHDPALTKVAFVGLFAAGAITAPLFAHDKLNGTDDAIDVALPPGAPCTVSARQVTLPAAGGGHTDRQFHEPDDATPLPSFGHSLGDGYVVVLYPRSLPEADVDRLRDYVTEPAARPIVAGACTDSAPRLSVVTSTQQMDCTEVHLGALRQFSTAWLESLGLTS